MLLFFDPFLKNFYFSFQNQVPAPVLLPGSRLEYCSGLQWQQDTMKVMNSTLKKNKCKTT